MESYIRDITSLKSYNTSIIISSATVIDRDYTNTIVLIPDHFKDCPSIPELVNALSKRLRDQRTCSVAISCICSHSYTLNHFTLPLCQAKTFASIWGHLETLRVSSSEALSRWLTTCLDSRSLDGYLYKFNDGKLKHGTIVSHDIVSRKRFNVRPESVSVLFAEKYFGECNNIKNAIIADAKLLSALKFIHNEPISTNDVITRDLS